MSSLTKVLLVGATLIVAAAPAMPAQQAPVRPAGPRAQYNVIPATRVRLGSPTLPSVITPWISESQSQTQSQSAAQRGPVLPQPLQPAVSRLYADESPAPPNDVLIIPVTTILIVLLVVLIIVAAD